MAPGAQVVYIDNEPIVLAHSRALLRAGRRGHCAYIDADARDVSRVLDEAAGTLDFTQPVAVIMLGLLHFIPDADEPYSLPGRYLDAFVPGSYLAVSHASSDIKQDGQSEAATSYNVQSTIPITLRSREEFAGSSAAWISSLLASCHSASGCRAPRKPGRRPCPPTRPWPASLKGQPG